MDDNRLKFYQGFLMMRKNATNKNATNKKFSFFCSFLMMFSFMGLLVLNSPWAQAGLITINHQFNSPKVAIIIHGLNTNPENMRSIEQYYRELQVNTVFLVLTGHEKTPKSLDEMKSVKTMDWLHDLQAAFLAAVHMGSQIHIAAFSLGGALTMYYLEKDPTFFPLVKSLNFWAPALKVNTTSEIFMQGLKIFSPSVIIPSMSEDKDKAQAKGTSVAAYLALNEMVQYLATNLDYKKYQQIPLNLFIDPQDELVSYKKLHDLWESLAPKVPWKFFTIHSLAKYHHLIVDPARLDYKEWQMMKTAIATSVR